MSKDEELTKYLALIEQYKEQMNSVEMQSSYLQAIINEYSKVKITLEQLIKIDKKSEVLLPIGGSTYIEASIINPSKVLFDIGAGLIVEKTSDNAIKKIDKRIEDLQKTQEKLYTIMQNLQKEATEVSEKAQKILNEENKN
ncbi:MAG: prefoldin subunit alpha [Candidatus Thermoplasmatota archaeon]|nr:prefoldin subunit alpha [Candidatus Thermoplasmatota archaeon]